MKKEIIDYRALFLGSKSENSDMFLKIINDVFLDQAIWRKNYHPSDENIIKASDKTNIDFIKTYEKLDGVLYNLSSKLRSGSVPWHSPRYIGHMNSETLMPGIVAYFEAMFYNGNNVAYESSPATSQMELEVGQDFVKMFGFTNKGWGHITSDGSIANLEGIWYARNFKSLPFALAKHNLVKNKSIWELQNMSVDEILDVLEKNLDKWSQIKDDSVRSDSSNVSKLGKLIVPRTKHYSWLKTADILGIGTNNVIQVDVDENFNIDIKKLDLLLNELNTKKIPILAVIGVVGSTEEGAIDPIHEIYELKLKYKALGLDFYLHVDAAYGGYVTSIFLDEKGNFIPFDKLNTNFKDYKVFNNDKINWPTKKIYDSFYAIRYADSITVDPHKMGYAPYSAGGFVIKDTRMKNAISYFAVYVFDPKTPIPALLGAYILEGSKSGATAASVWTCHRTLPLHIGGYGRLMGASIEGAYNLYKKIETIKSFKIDKYEIEVFLVSKPQFNMVDYTFNFKNNKNLDLLNELNLEIYNYSSFVSEELYRNDLLLSHSAFSFEEYGDVPREFVKKCKIPDTEWKRVQSISFIRSCVLSPWLNDPKVSEEYMNKFVESLEKKLKIIISKMIINKKLHLL